MAISTPSRSSGSPVRHIRRLLAARSAGVVVVWLFAAFNVLTGVWLLLSSLKNADEIFSTPWQLPHAAQWDNYARAWTTGLFGQAAFNTVVVVGGTAVVTLILAAPAAYALSRITTRFNGGFTLFFALGLGIPAQVVMLPLFVVMNKLFLVDSLFGLVVVYVATSLPFAVFFLTGFMSTLPVELEEAAALDGASPFRTFWQVMLPLARGGMVTVLILNIIQHWGRRSSPSSSSRTPRTRRSPSRCSASCSRCSSTGRTGAACSPVSPSSSCPSWPATSGSAGGSSRE